MDPRPDSSTIAAMILSTISNANSCVELIDGRLEKSPYADTFHLDRDSLVAIRSTLNALSLLTAKLFEENEEIMDMVDKIVRKVHSKPSVDSQ